MSTYLNKQTYFQEVLYFILVRQLKKRYANMLKLENRLLVYVGSDA